MELVEAQRQGRRHMHIPYRDSRLTYLLQASASVGGRLGRRHMHMLRGIPLHDCASGKCHVFPSLVQAVHMHNLCLIPCVALLLQASGLFYPVWG